MVEEVRVTRNYQVTIPAGVRKKLGVAVGDVLVVDLKDSKVTFEKKTFDISKLRLRLGKRVDWRDVETVVREAGERIGSADGG